MSSQWGKLYNIALFGESHGKGIGVVINGVPAGIPINMNNIKNDLNRRRPGQGSFATKRSETDEPDILSGINGDNYTTGSPVCAVFNNSDTHSNDYDDLKKLPRPSHSDYPAFIKYSGFNDTRGGGHFSGRITAGLVFAGALAKEILKYYINDIEINAIIKEIGNNQDKESFFNEIEKARLNEDSVGGVIECAVKGLPVGLGEPFFESAESVLAGLLFSIPAVKGVEFGSGFSIAKMLGSEANDPIVPISSEEKRKIGFKTNHAGGINGGLTNGNILIVRCAFRPTPSIGTEQKTVNLDTLNAETLKVKGRHDPCIVPRALPVVEAAVASGLLELYFEYKARKTNNNKNGADDL
jgi:chorismate synthase